MSTEISWGGSRGRRGGRRGPAGDSSGRPKAGDVVLDSGAVLAVLEEGPGRLEVEARLAAPGTAVIDAMSLLAVMSSLSDRGLSALEVDEVVDALALQIEPVNDDLARLAVVVRSELGAQGPSPAGCCSIALGRKLGLPVLVTDERLGGTEGVEVIEA